MPLQKIISELELPCHYKSNGCQETYPLEKLKSHFTQCKHRSIECPLKNSHDCSWEGNMKCIQEHFEKLHIDNLQLSLICTFSLKREITRDPRLPKLFIIGQTKILFDAVFNYETRKLLFSACNVDPMDSSYQLQVYTGEETQRSFICRLMDATNDTFGNDYHHYECQLHKDRSTENPIQLIVELIKNGNPCVLNLEGFNCIICHLMFRPPIFLCERGHSICGQCRTLTATCSLCRENYSSIRNFSLETCIETLNHSCKFANCKTVLPFNLIESHENNCKWNEFKCPFKNCKLRFPYEILKKHIETKHSKHVENTNACIFENNAMKCLLFKENIFAISIRTIDSSLAVCYLDLIPPTKKISYNCCLKLYNTRTTEWTLFKSFNVNNNHVEAIDIENNIKFYNKYFLEGIRVALHELK